MTSAASVVICTRDRPAELERCLGSLSKLDGPAPQLIVVDNSSGDRKVERIAASAGATYVQEPQTGLSRARNRGLAAASGRLIGFVDDDSVVDPGWLQRHSQAHARVEVGVTTGRIVPLSAAGTVGARLLDRGERGFRVRPADPHWFELVNFGGVGFGGNMVFKSAAFDGGLRFDPALGRGTPVEIAEDLYAFFMLVRDGYEIEYLPEAIALHDVARDPVELNTRELRGARGFAAYLCLLGHRHPAHRRTICRHLIAALSGREQAWRHNGRQGRALSRARLVAASLSGPTRYARSQWQAR